MDKNYREWKRKLGGIFAVIAKTISIFREIFAFFPRNRFARNECTSLILDHMEAIRTKPISLLSK